MEPRQDVTRLLHALGEGRAGALDELMALVYDDLSRIAARHLHERALRARAGATLESAALVNECYLRLVDQRRGFADRGQFFAIASRLMLRVLLDHQRRREALKRGGERARITLDVNLREGPTGEEGGLELATLSVALERLEALDPRKAEGVRLRGFGGCSLPEIAAQLEISLATAERDWASSRAWISREVARLRVELAWSLITLGDLSEADCLEALELAELAVRGLPEDSLVVNTLGVAQYRAGLLPEALETLRRAEARDGHPLNTVFMAMIHHDLGDAVRAEEVLEHARARISRNQVQPDIDTRMFLVEAEALLAGDRDSDR